MLHKFPALSCPVLSCPVLSCPAINPSTTKHHPHTCSQQRWPLPSRSAIFAALPPYFLSHNPSILPLPPSNHKVVYAVVCCAAGAGFAGFYFDIFYFIHFSNFLAIGAMMSHDMLVLRTFTIGALTFGIGKYPTNPNLSKADISPTEILTHPPPFISPFPIFAHTHSVQSDATDPSPSSCVLGCLLHRWSRSTDSANYLRGSPLSNVSQGARFI